MDALLGDNNGLFRDDVSTDQARIHILHPFLLTDDIDKSTPTTQTCPAQEEEVHEDRIDLLDTEMGAGQAESGAIDKAKRITTRYMTKVLGEP